MVAVITYPNRVTISIYANEQRSSSAILAYVMRARVPYIRADPESVQGGCTLHTVPIVFGQSSCILCITLCGFRCAVDETLQFVQAEKWRERNFCQTFKILSGIKIDGWKNCTLVVSFSSCDDLRNTVMSFLLIHSR